MKNPNSPYNQLKRKLIARWCEADYPEGEPRFQLMKLAGDIAVYLVLPICAIAMYKFIENTSFGKKKHSSQKAFTEVVRNLETKSQIIEFRNRSRGTDGISGFPKRAPGTLVKVRLLNVVETYSNAPVHAQIIDAGLGNGLMGGALIGDATPDNNFDRITILFRYVRDSNRQGVAMPVAARALSLDGTLGLEANKKEGFIARTVISSAHGIGQDAQGKNTDTDFKQVLFKALTSGLLQEFGTATQTEKNRSQVLSLAPAIEFFAELTDFFPGGSH